ncbi:MAG TPA: tetratricopeptide repeat protein [Candidatus Limnocylindria bacterium]|nr:tetratricopeptide repeat protein [Candidatus Limnocylindria bacterium]
MPRWHIACDECGVGAWIGATAAGVDAWCEGCQTSATLSAGQTAGSCTGCGGGLTVSEPRFEELYGELQNLAAVLAGWDGDPAPLGELLPDRPLFLTDLNPPAAQAEDAPEVRKALGLLVAGAFAGAGVLLEGLLADPVIPAEMRSGPAADARLWFALGVAAQRTGQLAVAEAAYGRTLALAPDHLPARLDRGALRARRGDHVGAKQDFAVSGTGREGRWNRAALAVIEAVASGRDLPAPELLQSARAEAGSPSPYWSDHTVGRLLWTTLVERARTRTGGEAPAGGDESVLERAQAELEFQTFWDRALVIHGYASLGMRRELETVAAPFAVELLNRLVDEPFLRGEAGREMRTSLETALQAARERSAGAARQPIVELLERQDLRHYRVPCLRCGKGSLGVDAVEDDELAETAEARD